MIDAIDWKILQILQANARVATAEIARHVEMAPSAVHERIRKLEESGVIEGYRPVLNPRRVGSGLLAFVFVRSQELPGDMSTGSHLAEIPEVLEVHHVAGEDCYLVKVRAAETEALGRLLREKFGSIPSVSSTRTTIVLETVKETSNPNLSAATEEGARD